MRRTDSRFLLAVALLVLPALLVGCAGSRKASKGRFANGWFVQQVPIASASGERTLTVRYKAGQPGSGWNAAPGGPGDFALFHERLGTTLYADTSCGARFDDAPLSALANHLTVGFTDVQIDDRQDLTLAGRAALERRIRARLDGVPVQLAVTVLKKGPCVFDVVAIGPDGDWTEGLAAYGVFRDGFDARVDG